MPGTIAQSVGVDIAKDTLDVHLHPVGRGRRFAISTKGCADLIAWLGGFVIAWIAFEPTGADHRAFERCLAAAGLPLVKFNPHQARRFAEAIGRHAKSDAVDAAMLGSRHGASDTDPAAGLNRPGPGNRSSTSAAA